jgi:hypothetical protein
MFPQGNYFRPGFGVSRADLVANVREARQPGQVLRNTASQHQSRRYSFQLVASIFLRPR